MKIEIGSNEAGQRLDKFLRKLLKDVPLSAIYKTLRKGDVKINGSKKKEKYVLELGDVVEIRDITTTASNKKKVVNFQKVDPSHLKIIFEDENLLILEKWPNVLVHGDKKGEITLTDFALSYLNDKGDYLPEQEVTFTPAPCNRLDRNTSGMVLFGKNFEALKQLNEMIRERKIKKYYMALVKGKMQSGTYEAFIMKDSENNISKIYDEEVPMSKKIAMEVKLIQTDALYSLIEIDLITGRSHQLRAHLAHLGYPIIGDQKYGERKVNEFFINKYGLNYQFLYAYKLIFRNCTEKFQYMENKTVAEALPPIFKKIKKDVFRVVIR
ncbi:RluA family pseudouridine synthase [Alloiococcus sp. CFN-8]|uniref:RluA family pseudouridine synthase n=1 Tax=Alloiococcus sp. CFN-8 TaxID=3416081 RepID=UPI003CEF0C89